MAQTTVTGYSLRNAMARKQIRVDAAVVAFPTALTKFADETKDSPIAISTHLAQQERELAILQTAQAEYNNLVKVRVLDEQMTLTQAVKLLGGANRRVQLWKSVVGTPQSAERRRFYHGDPTPASRAKDTEYAVPTITPDQAREQLEMAMTYANALKAAIAEGNAKPVEVDLPVGVYET